MIKSLLAVPLSTSWCNAIRSFLGVTAFVLLSSFVLGTNMTAQTPSEFGEVATEQVVKMFEGEIKFLETEAQQQPAGVDISKNKRLIEAYDAAATNFRRGSDLKKELAGVYGSLDERNRKSLESNQNFNHSASNSDGLSSSFPFLDNITITKSDLSGLNEFFQHIRNLKNK